MVRKNSKLIEKLKKFRREVNSEVPLSKVYLFGSRAWGRPHKDSDIDLIIVSPKFKKMDFFKRTAKMYDYWTIREPVDFLCYAPKEFNKLKRQISIVAEAVKRGIEI